MTTKRYFLLLLTFVFLTVHAQTGRLLTADRELSSSMVGQVFQDHDGLIWIATLNGLVHYDGYRSQIYMPMSGEEGADQGMVGYNVRSIAQARDGKIILGFFNGVQTFDRKRFETVEMLDLSGASRQCYVNHILVRRNGDVLVATSGVGVMKLDADGKARQMGGALASVAFPRHLMEAADGTLWIATEDQGVVALKGHNVKHYLNAPGQRTLATCLCQDGQGNIYVANANDGLSVLRKGSGHFEKIPATAVSPVVSLAASRDGSLLVGTNGYGLYRYQPTTGAYTPSGYFSNEVDLSQGKVYSVMEDRQGNVWLGLLQKGVFVQPAAFSGFEYMGYHLGAANVIGEGCLMAVHRSNDGLLWIATDNHGLYAVDTARQLRHRLKPGKNGMGVPATVLAMATDTRGTLWVGSFTEGAGSIDKTTGAYNRLPFTTGNAQSVFDIKADKRGYVWLGTMGDGLKRYDPATGQLKEYRFESSNDKSLPNDYIAQLAFSPDERRLYVATSDGLSCLDIASDSWTKVLGTNHILPGTGVSSMCEAADGVVWITSSKGVHSYNLRSKQLRHYTTPSGLSSDNAMAVEIDRAGMVWVSTSRGLNRLDPNTGIIDNYFVGDGLQGNEFTDGVSLKDPSGNIYFGGTGGLTKFNPQTLPRSPRKVSMLLTNIVVGNEVVTAGMKSGVYTITDSIITHSRRFELAHNDNSLTMSFSTLSYDNPERIAFAYSVNNEEWIVMPAGKNTLTFSHLAAGTYHLRVKGMDNQNESEVLELEIVVHPVWYMSWWAWLIYFALACFALWRYLQSRKRKEQERLRMQEHIHAEQISEAKIKFFINISHEIRTPLTLIIAPLLTLMKNDNDAARHGTYTTIKRNAERILHLVNQIMDLRKIDKGLMAMRMVETDLVGFAQNIYTLFEFQAKNKNIDLQLHTDAPKIKIWLDKDNFDKVLVNILGNALKYTRPGGHILIDITHNEQSATITVSDDGEQIPEDKLERIFERFFQVRTLAGDRQVGTGIGLDLTRSLVELHHGTIRACNNENGKGCAFIVDMPLGSSHLKPEEMASGDADDDEQTLHDLFADSAMQTDGEAATPDGDGHEGGKGKRPTIVVVEDDEEIRQYLCQQLGDKYRVIGKNNGKDALALVLQEIPQLVISDVMMPIMDGTTLCLKIKDNVNTNHIPVILLTRKNRDEDKLEGLETGADAYVEKPFNMELLRQTIVNLLKERSILQNKYTGQEGQDDKVDKVELQSHDSKLMERVMAYVNANLDNPDISVEQMATEVGLSRVHLYRKLKELTNHSPQAFIRNIRLKQAANLLATGNQSITEVMWACGFVNLTSFSTMFKKFYGKSPRDYMQEHRQSTT